MREGAIADRIKSFVARNGKGVSEVRIIDTAHFPFSIYLHSSRHGNGVRC